MNWPNSAPATGIAQASLARLRSAIAIANGLIVSGRAVDLAGLDGLAGLLCAQVLDLPIEEGRALRPFLAAADDSIARLITALSIDRT